jgi:hypothetical protein
MLDTVGPELQVFNKSEKPIALEADALVTITPDVSQEASSEILPINYAHLASVRIRGAKLLCAHSLWLLVFIYGFPCKGRSYWGYHFCWPISVHWK